MQLLRYENTEQRIVYGETLQNGEEEGDSRIHNQNQCLRENSNGTRRKEQGTELPHLRSFTVFIDNLNLLKSFDSQLLFKGDFRSL